MFSQFLAVAYKEVLHVLRDPSTRVVFLIPVFELALFGYAVDLQVINVPVGVADLDETTRSRQLRVEMDNTETLDLNRRYTSLAALEEGVVAGEVHAGLYIPPSYARALARGEESQVLLIVDGSYSTEANATMVAANRVASRAGQVKFKPRELAELRRGRVDLRGRFLFNPELRTANFFIPGLAGIIMQLVTVLLTAFSIVRERELGTLEQLLVTPVSRGALIVGKLAPYFGIAIIQTALVFLAMVYAFDVPIHGSLVSLMLLSGLFIVTSLALGVLISTKARTQSEAMQLALLTILPSILLSGFIFPLAGIPDIIQPLTYLVPVRYFIEILRGLIVRGTTVGSLWFETVALFAYTLLLLGAAAKGFRKTVD